MTDREAMEASAGTRLALIAESFARLTGEELADGSGAVWSAPRAIVAHGTEDPPLFFYANALALDLFRMSAADFIGLPSYRSAEPALRGERAAMLARLAAEDVVRDYRGVRIAADKTRFRIERATIWNIRDRKGKLFGQAAAIPEWTML